MNLGDLGWNGYTGMHPATAVTISKLPAGFQPFLGEEMHDRPIERPPIEFMGLEEGAVRVSCQDCLAYEAREKAYRREILALERSLQQKAKADEDAARRRPWSLEKDRDVSAVMTWGVA